MAIGSSEKVNPHLKALREIMAFVEASKEEADTKAITKKLEKLYSEMDDSPLVLKMRPGALSVVNSADYLKRFRNHKNWLGEDEKEMVLGLLLNTVELSHWTLTMAEQTDSYEPTSRALAKVLWMIEKYVGSHLAMKELEPEEAAVACLIGASPGGWGAYSFWTFNKEIEEAEKETEDA